MQNQPTSGIRDWIDPTRIYNPRTPAGRWQFAWGLAIYPFIVLFVLLTVAILLIESLSPATDNADVIGIVTYVFMLGWVAAAVCMCLRRMRRLRILPDYWVWLVILPVINLGFFIYLLLKSEPQG